MSRRHFPDNKIWANSPSEITDPTSALWANAYESGEGKAPPEAGVHNYIFNRSDEQHQHIEQNGIPRWLTDTEYADGGLALGSDNVIYQSQGAANQGNDPTTDDGTNWIPLPSVNLSFDPSGSTLSSENPEDAIKELDAKFESGPYLEETNNLSDVDDPGAALGNIFTAGSGISRSGTTVSVDSSGISVSQSNLNTSIGSVTVTGAESVVLPGGEYGFYPQTRIDGNFSSSDGVVIDSALSTSLGDRATKIAPIDTVDFTAWQRYIQSSPPYDLGDGDIPIFVFAILNSKGEVVSTYTAEDPPWANNGPTNTRPDVYRREERGGKTVTVGYQYRRRALADDERKAVVNGEMGRPEPELVEVDQSIKNADMGVIPHPFANAPSGHTVVLLDPVKTQGLHELHLQGESIAELLHGGYVGVDKDALKRCCPKGVQAHGFRWKGSK